ncbi:MAG: hypothetical protein [Olavius algarvensis Delta 4 endosymbiont]|nr:MAG: hypothetical protein [Olavius algarvensis Delta 4 endosymbiont]
MTYIPLNKFNQNHISRGDAGAQRKSKTILVSFAEKTKHIKFLSYFDEKMCS